MTRPPTTDGPSFPETADVVLRWLEVEQRARLIVDGQLKVIWSNAAARRLLSDTGIVEQRDDALVAGDGHAHERLNGFVNGCSEDPRTLLIRHPHREDHLIIRGQRIAEPDGSPLVGILLLRSEDFAQPEESAGSLYAGLDQAFGLTPAEFRIVRALLDGCTADEIADRHELSIDTVRSHIRRTYQKMNVSSREGLFRRVRPFSY